MQSKAPTPEQYIDELPDDRREVIGKLRSIIRKNLPKGFHEEMSYGSIGYVVPHSIYPKGYHTNPSLPLPFMALASQKNFVALYHMGIYNEETLLTWFKAEYTKLCRSKLDMGKGCIRFKKLDDIPYALVGQLASKITPKEWVVKYEKCYLLK